MWMNVLRVLVGVWALSAPAFAQQVPVRPGAPPPRPPQSQQVQPQRPPAPPGRVGVEVTVVYADKSGRVDPQLTSLARQFEIMNLTGFQVLAHHDTTLLVGQDTTFNVEGDRKLQLTMVARDSAVARVRIQMFTGGVLKVDSTSRIPRGEYYTVAGPTYRDGRLIYLIGVDY